MPSREGAWVRTPSEIAKGLALGFGILFRSLHRPPADDFNAVARFT